MAGAAGGCGCGAKDCSGWCSAPSTAAPPSSGEDDVMPFTPPLVAEDVVPLTPPMGDEDAIPFTPPMAMELEPAAAPRTPLMSAEEDEEERRAIVAAATTPLNDLGEYEGFGDGVDSEDLDYYDDQDWEFA
ncbi:unnamed protein product, partial [Prorocentrum cordatum]